MRLRGTPLLVHGFILMVLMASPGSGAAQSNTLDPQSLIGEWWGQWTTRDGRTGQYYVSVESVNGQTVTGKVSGTVRSAFEFRFRGSLADRTLSFRGTQLTIDGDTMRGTWNVESGPSRTIAVSKRK